ncbi:MAG: ribonuclease HII [Patescibacteria group bacterium]|nr:ribonuclease HII [Patescibacteria group bacterium]
MVNSLCGLDEAGRGALAGPLVAAAVILKPAELPDFLPLKDGKLLSRRQRSLWHETILRRKDFFLTETISVSLINKHGVGWANKEVFRRLIKKISAQKYVVDGNLKIGGLNGKSRKVQSLAHADSFIPEVILAGILAKVTRDKIMQKLDQKHPQYLWNQNVGYGTKKHLESLKTFGKTRFHRDVFVNSALKNTFNRFAPSIRSPIGTRARNGLLKNLLKNVITL